MKAAIKLLTVFGGGPLPAPTLTAPANNALETADNTPDFSWSSVPGATLYHIQIDNNSDFSSPIVDDATLVTNSYTPGSALPNGILYWRVAGINAGGTQGAWSSTFTLSMAVLLVTANLKLRYVSAVGLFQDNTLTTPAAADNDPVGGWDDQSASNWNATQATAGNKPTRQTLTVGARTFPVVRGNSTAAFLSISGISLPSDSWTIYLAATGLTGTTLKFYFDTPTGRLIIAAQTDSSGKVGWFDGGWKSIADATAAFQILTQKLVSGGNGTVYRNGVSLGSAAYTAKALSAPSALFAQNAGTSSWAAVDIAEFMIFSGAHSDEDRASVELYLATRYGVTLNP